MTVILLGSFAAATATFLAACGSSWRSDVDQDPVTYESHEQPPVILPTNEISQQLLMYDDPPRRAWFQRMLTSAGKRCNIVTSDKLIGALDGTDEWQLRCQDSGSWGVWFKADARTDIVRCSRATCT